MTLINILMILATLILVAGFNLLIFIANRELGSNWSPGESHVLYFCACVIATLMLGAPSAILIGLFFENIFLTALIVFGLQAVLAIIAYVTGRREQKRYEQAV